MKIKFKKQDAWMGIYWDFKHIYICLIPCFPIIIQRDTRETCRKCPYCENEGSYNAARDGVVVCVACDRCGDHCQCDEDDF